MLNFWDVYMDVSENSGTPKSSILIRLSIINHPFWGNPIFGNTHILDGSIFQAVFFRIRWIPDRALALVRTADITVRDKVRVRIP